MTTPDYETGRGCWRYGVDETQRSFNGTVKEPKVTYGNWKVLTENCGQKPTDRQWGCYVPVKHEIYLLTKGGIDAGGKFTYIHEMCHAAGFMKHNRCQGYGFGESQADCDWNES
jgi:hypothetical protein